MNSVWWHTRIIPIMFDAAATMIVADDKSAHKIDMSDPKQDMTFNVGTSTDQLRLAVQTIETELQNPDGVMIDSDDVAEATQALQVLRTIIDRIETKGAGYMAEHKEKPRSDRT